MTASHLYTLRLKTERSHAALSGNATTGEIPTTTEGGLWGAYLMTVAHFYKELASYKLAIS